MKNIVCKFGGSSVADGAALCRVKSIVSQSRSRRVIVVSAPGKRFSGDRKVTDLLYAAAKAAVLRKGDAFSSLYRAAAERFEAIASALFLSASFCAGLRAEIERIEGKIYGERSSAYAASRGEYLLAKIAAEYLRMPFIDAAEVVFFSADGKIENRTYAAVKERLTGEMRAVLPGFYGSDDSGKIVTFTRGGGDVTGAIAAKAVGADLLEKWTDVSGVFSRDPKRFPQGAAIDCLTYEKWSEVFRFSGGILHTEAARILREAGIPVRVCNTFRPEDRGTMIVP